MHNKNTSIKKRFYIILIDLLLKNFGLIFAQINPKLNQQQGVVSYFTCLSLMFKAKPSKRAALNIQLYVY